MAEICLPQHAGAYQPKDWLKTWLCMISLRYCEIDRNQAHFITKLPYAKAYPHVSLFIFPHGAELQAKSAHRVTLGLINSSKDDLPVLGRD